MFKFNFFRSLVILSLVFCLNLAAFADTIKLKDGSLIKGRIVGFSGGKFTVVMDDGSKQRQMNFTADEIDVIVFDSGSSLAPVANTSNQTSPQPTNIDGNTTVIKVGQVPKSTDAENNQSKTSPTPLPTPNTSAANNTVSKPKPIELNVKVAADNTSNGWTNSGWVVRKGQKIRITGSGQISLGNGRTSNPGGIATLADSEKLRKDAPTGGLIAVIGDDNNDFIFIGQSHEFVAARDGALFLGVNEGNLNDNSGTFETRIEIEIDPN